VVTSKKKSILDDTLNEDEQFPNDHQVDSSEESDSEDVSSAMEA